MLSKMLRASRQNRTLLRNARSLLTTQRRTFSDEVSTNTSGAPAQRASVNPTGPYRNIRSTLEIADIVR